MKISHTIKTLIISDFLINSGFSVFAPIFAVFVTKQISNSSVSVVGFAAGITQFFKVCLQIPIAKYLDKNHGEYDDFISLILGTTMATITPFLYYFANTPTHIYLIQAWYGISLALAVPPWSAIFTRHIDHDKENIEWSMESVSIGVAGAIFAAAGGLLAEHIGFRSLFLLGGIIAIWGAFAQLLIYKDLRAKVPQGFVKPVPEHISE